MKLAGWGNYPVHDARVRAPRDEAALKQMVTDGQAIARGNGRSYGDSAVSVLNTIHMAHFDRMLSFDEDSGILVAESGVLLSDVIQVFLPRGWFPYVTPGTKFVTLGGLIAADVHGKNHHKHGSFGNFVEWLDLLDGNGRVCRCSRSENQELFAWTLGGMGLTGIIVRAALRLRRVETAWIRQTTLAALNLDHAIELFEQHNQSTYSVAWIDCLSRGERLGRSLLMLGEHAKADEIAPEPRRDPLKLAPRRSVAVPFNLPSWLLNRHTVAAFNSIYYRRGMRASRPSIVGWDAYFYPLDSVGHWNRIYGRRGFVQFQCVLPTESARRGLGTMLKAMSDAGAGSFLAVLKKLGPSAGGLSFALDGYTLALDFAVSHPALALLRSLERMAVDHGGRFYLAKDANLTAELMSAADGRAAAFRKYREEMGLMPAFQSVQSQRLAI